VCVPRPNAERPPMRGTHTLDRVPTLERVPPRNTSLGNVFKPALGPGTRSAPVAHVPHGVDSDDEPPPPPPKAREDERAESPEEGQTQTRLSHAFIAPALPPIRFSMSADLSDLLRNVGGGGRPSLEQLQALADAQDGSASSGGTPPATPSSAESEALRTPASSRATTVEDGGARLKPAAVEDGESPTPTFAISFNRDAPRLLVNGQEEDDEEDQGRDAPPARALSPPETARERDMAQTRARERERERADVVTRRVQEVLTDANQRRVTHIKLDLPFVQAISDVLDQRQKEINQMKARFDGAKVSVSVSE
jgi:hypothetical protein